MAIKGGDLLHVGNQILLERAQTAGPGQVNLSPEKVYELGNYLSIATLFDIPDLSFSLDSLDASAELEALLVGEDFAGMAAGTAIDVSRALPLDVIGQIKPGRNAASPYAVVGSVATPYLALESLSYKFGLKDKAAQTAGFKGDSIYYNPGAAIVEEVVGTNTAGQAIILAHPAYPYNGDVVAGTKYTLAVCLASGKRLFFGTDYTEVATGAGASKAVTVTITAPVPVSDKVRIVYSTSDAVSYPQASHTADSATHPAAIRGRDITVYVGGEALIDRWSDVQSVQVDWKVQLQQDEQFGSSVYVDQDFDVPTVNGNVVVRPRDYASLLAKIQTIAGVGAATEVTGALATTPLEVLIVLHSPTDGSVLKCLEIPDARITVPGYSGQVQQKLDLTFNFESDTGLLNVYKNAKTGLPTGV
jgi:hypothetical protein